MMMMQTLSAAWDGAAAAADDATMHRCNNATKKCVHNVHPAASTGHRWLHQISLSTASSFESLQRPVVERTSNKPAQDNDRKSSHLDAAGRPADSAIIISYFFHARDHTRAAHNGLTSGVLSGKLISTLSGPKMELARSLGRMMQQRLRLTHSTRSNQPTDRPHLSSRCVLHKQLLHHRDDYVFGNCCRCCIIVVHVAGI